MKKVIAYICKKKSGFRKDLILFCGGDSDFVDKLALLGYISQGTAKVKGEYLRTYNMTEKSLDYNNVYNKGFNFFEMLNDRFLHTFG